LTSDLVKHINRGDKKVFHELFDQFFNALSAFAYRYVNDITIAQDMSQEAFISLWEKRKNFDQPTAIKAFLYTSVRNKSLNFLKHQNVLKKHQQALVYELESEQFFTNHVIEEETFNQLYAEIRDLPVAAREIMILAMNGLKNQEIAEELNISVNTVKTQKKISYAKLKEKLGRVTQAILLSF